MTDFIKRIIKHPYFAFLAIKEIKNCADYFLDLFKLINKDYIIFNLKNGLRYCIRPNTTDRYTVMSVDINDEYKINNLNLPTDATIIDIGGHIGIFSIHASKKIKNLEREREKKYICV